MLFWYELVNCICYFLFMIIFMVISIVAAKRKGAWIWYAVGAILQLLPLLGNQKAATMNSTDTTKDWIVYFALLIVSAILIVKRYNKANSSSSTDKGE